MIRWFCSVAILLACSVSFGQMFHVSPEGNDSNPGTADKPFATLARAQAAARDWWAKNLQSSQIVTVRLGSGTYTITEPLSFTPADCNTTYAAAPNATPIISGGVVLKGFRNENGRWTVRIPEVQQGKWNFSQLWVNGQRRYRPRLPKNSYWYVAEKLEPTEKNKTKGSDRIRFTGDQIKADWANLGDVEVLCFQVWTMARMRIESVDALNHIVNFTGHTRGLANYSIFDKGRRFIVENVKEALSEPGEWYLDRPTGTLTYIPMPGETIESAQIVAPRAESFIQIKGEPGKPVSNLVFRGLTFAYSNWNSPPEGNNFAQAEVNLPGAILANSAQNCVFENCKVMGVGTYGIELAANCRNNRIERCEFTDLAAGGIKLGLMRRETPEDQATGHNIVRDNLFAHGGRMHPAAHGVWIGHSAYNTVEHNDIHDFYYTGISVGWSWGYNPCGSHHNTIAYNHIYDIGQGVLSDMGGIYTLGLADGTVLHHNLIHHIHAFDYGGWGIYFDEGTTHQVAENNVVYRTKTGGFHQHYGKENIVRNNIFAFAIKDQIQRTRTEEHLSFTFERNIVYWNQGELLGSNWRDNNFKMDYNLYWQADGKPFTFFRNSLEEWRKRGQDEHSIIADPMFVDPQNGNFTLKPGSPAGKIGFKPIDLSKTGRITKGSVDQKTPAAFPLVLPN